MTRLRCFCIEQIGLSDWEDCCLAAQGSMSDPKTTLGQGVKMLRGGGGIFKSAAVAVLRQERRLTTTGDITKYAAFRAVLSPCPDGISAQHYAKMHQCQMKSMSWIYAHQI